MRQQVVHPAASWENDSSQDDVYWDVVYFCVTLAKELDVAVAQSGELMMLAAFWDEEQPDYDAVLVEDHRLVNDAYEVSI